jgi:hypothetical protein
MEFKEIWDTFSQIKKEDLPIAKKGNMNLDYLSWAHALHLAIDSFPNLTFHCDKEKSYDDGSMMVFASVTIEENTREMWLPVMDNKNNSIINPSSRQVSDNKMRCLVKCLALFGLGLNVYAGEDLKYLDEETPAPKPKKKAPAKEPKAKEPDDLKLVSDGIKDLMKMETTVDGLRSFWSNNNENIERMKAEDPDLYNELVEAFKAYKETLENPKEG